MTADTLLPADAADLSVDLGEHVVILAPQGRDAAVAGGLLERDGIRTLAAANLEALADLVDRRIGAVLATEETMSGRQFPLLKSVLDSQPSWSDLPFIVLANGAAGARSTAARARIDDMGNVVLLSRPLHAEELLRAVRSALKARRRQYEARDRMEQLELRERELRVSETKFLAIANSVDQMIWSTLPDGHHDYFNDRWYEFTGIPHGSTDGRAWKGVFHPDDRARARDAWRHSLATGEPYECEYRLRDASGTYRWVLGRANAVRDEAGRIVRWYGSCTDIDDEVRAREAAVEDLTRQRDRAWDRSPDLMAVARADGILEVLNRAWTDILGWPTDALRGTQVLELVHPDDMADATRVLSDISHAPLVDPYELRMRHKDGSYRWFAWTASAHEGQVFATGRDVSERRAKDAALAAAEAALRQSQKLEMIGQLTGGVAHDFNNLLAAIRSSLTLARRNIPPDEGVIRYLDNAIAATDRGASLTHRMLAFARQQDLHIGSVDIGQTLPGLRDLLERSLGPQIELVIDVPQGLPPARADVNQLEMALLNLAVNGRDAMEENGCLTLSARTVDVGEAPDLPPGRYVEISVKDTGTGMDAATLGRATEPFFTTKGVGRGTGLGLSMVHGLAKQSSGSFRLESTLGKGTTALIYLPSSAEAERTVPTPAPEPPPEPASRKDRLTILAVDDDALVLMGTVGMLEDLGHQVIEASTGIDALETLKANQDIDLLITDQAMPRMTGSELARLARELRPGLPIILATGYAEMPEGAAANITTKLDKPFSDQELARAVQTSCC